MIRLRGKFKIDFENYFQDKYIGWSLHYSWYNLPFSMQIGVYESFTDYINIDFSTKPIYIERKKEYVSEVDKVYFFYNKIRDKASKEGLEQLQKIYNEKFK